MFMNQALWMKSSGQPLSMAEQYEMLRARPSRRSVLKGAALLSASPLFLQAGTADAAVPMGPRWVAFGDDPLTAMTVSTSMPGTFQKATVEYGVDAGLGSSVPLDVKGVTGTPTRYGSARLIGLSPGKSYHYRIRVDGRDSVASTFDTAPVDPGPFTFTAFGDEGTTGKSREVVALVAAERPALHLVAGDLCYAYTAGTGLSTGKFKPANWDRWLSIIEPVASKVPWMTAVGNHEMEPGFGPQGYNGYLNRFTLPRNGASGCPSTYHFKYGGVGFIQVDSNDVSYEIPHNLGYSHGAQDPWLESVLASYRAPGSGVDFIVVTMHHCAYSTATAHGSEGGVRDHWTKLFDRYSVDLVISGHNHSYERSHPIRAGVKTQHASRGQTADSALGTTYLTVGGGGVGLNAGGFYKHHTHVSTPDTSKSGKSHLETAENWSAVTDTSYCFALCRVTTSSSQAGPALALTMFNEKGQRIDAVTLERRSQPAAGSDTGLYIGLGAGAAGLVAAGAGYLTLRSRR